MPWNLNYPDYEEMGYGSYRPPPPAAGNSQMGHAATALNQTGDAGSQVPNPYVQGGSLALKLLGTGLSAWGTYRAQEETQRQFDEQMREFREEKERERQREEEAKRQRELQNMIGFGNYARQMEQDVYGTYSPHARKAGL